MTEIQGTWRVEGNNKVYVQSPYTVTFIRMPEREDSEVQNLYEIHIAKNNEQVMRFGFQKERTQRSVSYLLLEINPENYTFIIRNYGAVEQDKDVLAIHCIERYEDFEKNVLTHLPPPKYKEVRQRVVERLSTMFDEVLGMYISFTTPYFMVLKFEPKKTRKNYIVYVAYDYRNDRVNLLTTKESFEGFFTRNRIELNNGANESLIQEKNRDILVSFLKRGSVNQFRWVVASVKDVLDISFVDDSNRKEVEGRLKAAEKRIAPLSIANGEMRVVYLNTWYPGELEEWRIKEHEGRITITAETILRDIYLPSFMDADPESLEKTSHYR